MAGKANVKSSEHVPGGVKSGFVALVGRPNAGKSTLTNAIVGSKVAITSDKPQTTRQRLRAVYDRDDAQLVIVDTPGLHKPIDALGAELNRAALSSLEDVDVAALLIDATAPVGTGDEWVARHVAASKAKKLLVLTKADVATAKQVDTQLRAARALADFDDEVVVSALNGHNVKRFVEAAIRLLPYGPRWFPRDMPTDQPLEMTIAEFIREKVLRETTDEIPHAVGVVVDDLDFDERRDLWTIDAIVYVERDSQKGIIIGKRGEMLKAIGTHARVDLERLLGGRVFLNLSVKVKANWRRDEAQVRRFGYGQGQ
ncbi:MAG: GTPase Era [Coriobacteriia bacterium]